MRYIYELKDRVKVVTAGPRQGQVATVVEKWRRKVWLRFGDEIDDQEFFYEDLEPVKPYTKKGVLKAKRSLLHLTACARSKWEPRDLLQAVCHYLKEKRPELLPLFQADYTQCLIDRKAFVVFLRGWGIKIAPGHFNTTGVFTFNEETHHV